VFGNPGSRISSDRSLAQELIVAREPKMHFTKCALLMQDLLAAKRDLRLRAATWLVTCLKLIYTSAMSNL
jgi:hypothetical protein